MEKYEQKYNEALERARDLMVNQNPPAFDKDLISLVFPELKESEDKKIRRELRNDLLLYVPTPERYIAWLEKQGNNQNWKPSKGQINALEHFIRSIGESGYASPYDANTKLLISLLNDLYKLEKQ